MDCAGYMMMASKWNNNNSNDDDSIDTRQRHIIKVRGIIKIVNIDESGSVA